MIDLSGKVAMVTGGSRGIGRACALKLAQAGADVVVNYHGATAEAESIAAEIQGLGRNAAMVRADVSESDDCQALCEFVREQYARLDILIHNAASGGFRPLLQANPTHFDNALHTNALSLLHLAQSAADLLAAHRAGKVVVLSSAGTHRAIPNYGLIGASKAALAALARHLAMELGPRGVNVNIVEAGMVDTDSTRNIPGAEQMLAARSSRSLIGGRTLEASDVADAVLFLASPLADLVQGQTLVVDAGAAMHP